MRILLIDDDAVFRETLARACKRRGCDVAIAEDGAAALMLVESFQPEACVLDLRLAGESGLALIPRLRGLVPDLRILMLTGYSAIATAVEAIKLGAFNYLAKPASVDDILRALDEDQSAGDAEPPGETEEDVLSVDRLAWEHIQRVLLEEGGNISATARRLGMHRRTLQRRLMKRPVAR